VLGHALGVGEERPEAADRVPQIRLADQRLVIGHRPQGFETEPRPMGHRFERRGRRDGDPVTTGAEGIPKGDERQDIPMGADGDQVDVERVRKSSHAMGPLQSLTVRSARYRI